MTMRPVDRVRSRVVSPLGKGGPGGVFPARDTRLPLAAALLVTVLAAGSASLGAERDVAGTIVSGDRTRTWILHVPPGVDPAKPAALVIALHGGGGAAEGFERVTHLSELADSQKFLLASPNGTGPFRGQRVLTWNAGNCCGFALEQNVDDVAFLRAMVRRIREDWSVDPRRIFATGISNGAMMAYRMACEMADVVTGIAPVAGALNAHPCKPVRPVSVIAFHGTSDLHVLYEGGPPVRRADVRHPRSDMSVADAVAFWTERDGCPKMPKRGSSGSIGRTVYGPCRENTAVEVVTVRGGGHAWPGGAKWAAWADEPTREISASKAMWEFFQAHPRGGPP